jgi:membrane dipeptidase
VIDLPSGERCHARVRALVVGGGAALCAMLAAMTTYARDESDLRDRAERIHRDAIVVDGHNDITTFILDYQFDLGMDGSGPGKQDATLYWVPAIRWLLPRLEADNLRTDTDLRRLRTGGIDAEFFSIFVDSSYVPRDSSQAGRAKDRALAMIGAVLEQVRRHPDDLELATSAADVRRIAAAGRIAALMGLEGGHAIEDDLSNLRQFFDLGVRYMTLTWNNANDWADSCYEHPHRGLTDFGREVVLEMNRLGMVVDVSHVSDDTFFDVIETTRAPIMASHSSARALADHPRNMSDEMLRAVARNGGVVMVNFQDWFIDPAKTPVWGALLFAIRHLGWPDTPLSVLIDHIDHIVAVAGIDHVGLGSDFADTFLTPDGVKDVAGFPNITSQLLIRGYSEGEIRKILGENALRVLSAVELVGQELRAAAEPAAQQAEEGTSGALVRIARCWDGRCPRRRCGCRPRARSDRSGGFLIHRGCAGGLRRGCWPQLDAQSVGRRGDSMRTGRCYCGAVRYELVGSIGPLLNCHCKCCRRAHGAAFVTSCLERRRDLRVTAGDAQVREYETAGGFRY